MKFDNLAQLINNASQVLLQAKEGEANVLLSEVFDELLILTPTAPTEVILTLIQVIKIMHEAQQRRDYVYLVDILRYEIPELIGFSLIS